MNDRAARLGPVVGIQQRHGMVLHEVSKAESNGAADTHGTVQQCVALLHFHTMDVISDWVKNVTEV